MTWGRDLAASDLTVDPLFWTAKTGPYHCVLRWTPSPAYQSDSTDRHHRAHQNTAPGKGTVVMFR